MPSLGRPSEWRFVYLLYCGLIVGQFLISIPLDCVLEYHDWLLHLAVGLLLLVPVVLAT